MTFPTGKWDVHSPLTLCWNKSVKKGHYRLSSMIGIQLETYNFPSSLATQNVQGWSSTRLPPTMLSSPFPTWILVVQFLGLRRSPLRAEVQCQVAMSYDLLYSNDTSAKDSYTKHIISFLSLSYFILPWRYTDKMQQVEGDLTVRGNSCCLICERVFGFVQTNQTQRCCRGLYYCNLHRVDSTKFTVY